MERLSTPPPTARGGMRVLVVNSGSSTLKLRVMAAADTVVETIDLPAVHRLAPDDLARVVDGLGAIDAVGHRIVHGGGEYAEPVLIDDQVRARLRAFTQLAPLHQPAALTALDAISGLTGDVPAVACFDTAFHGTLPPAAATYAVPAAWREQHGLRRYGFHGLSHAYASRRALAMLAGTTLGGMPLERQRHSRVVTCHLGAGASLTAVLDGRAIDTTMGFTPLEGLVMATRSGSVDPGGLMWLITERGLDPAAVADALEHESGLVALAGTPDMAAVVEAARAGEPAARLAFDVYLHRLRAGVAAMTAALGGLDALVFTGGIGENSPAVRDAAAAGLGFLGVAIDPDANAEPRLDADVAAVGAPARVFVIAAREDLEIARGVRGVLGAR